MKKYMILVNKYPFWLLWNYSTEAKVDFNEKILQSEVTESGFETVNPIEIFMIKYLPFILIFGFLVRFPNSLKELFILAVTAITMGIGVLIKQKSTRYFKMYLFAVFMSMEILFFQIDNIGKILNLALGDFIILFMLFFLLYDALKYGVKDYYYLTEVKNKGEVTISKHKKRKALRVPFTQKHLLKIPTGFNASFNYAVGGYYFKVIKTGDEQNA